MTAMSGFVEFGLGATAGRAAFAQMFRTPIPDALAGTPHNTG
jgi:hypothetical protein